MKKMLIVMRHEFWGLVKSKSFIVATAIFVFLPLFLLGIIGVMGLGDMATTPIGYVDNAGIISEEQDIDFVRYDSEELAEVGYSSGEIAGYYIIPNNFINTGELYLYYTSGSMLSENRMELSKGKMREAILFGLTKGYLPEAVKQRVTEPIVISDVGLSETGTATTEDTLGMSSSFSMILGFGFLLIVALPSGYFLTGLMEEKTSKVSEILLSSVSPLQLYMGKVLGLGMAGLVQISAIVVGNIVFMGMFGALGLGMVMSGGLGADVAIGSTLGNLGAMLFPQGIFIFLMGTVIYFLLGYLMYAGVLIMVASFCNTERQASQYQVIFALAWFVPIFLVMTSGVDSGAIVALSIFPLTAPVAMVMRLSAIAVPVWEFLVSIVLVVLTIGGIVWVSLQIFKSGSLVTGNGFSLKSLLVRR